MTTRRITLAEAADRIGGKVLYHSGHTPVEEGVITSVNDRYVFVRYGSQTTSAATLPSMLTFLAPAVVAGRDEEAAKLLTGMPNAKRGDATVDLAEYVDNPEYRAMIDAKRGVLPPGRDTTGSPQ